MESFSREKKMQAYSPRWRRQLRQGDWGAGGGIQVQVCLANHIPFALFPFDGFLSQFGRRKGLGSGGVAKRRRVVLGLPLIIVLFLFVVN